MICHFCNATQTETTLREQGQYWYCVDVAACWIRRGERFKRGDVAGKETP